MKLKLHKIIAAFSLLTLIMLGACSKSQSYSELLRDEEKAVNWYLSGQKVELELPADSVSFIMGPDAPYYKLDENGYVYMQVIKADFSERVEEGDLVYFRFMRDNLLYLYEGINSAPTGNSDYLSYGPASFIYKNTYLNSSTTWGTGIQMPLKFLGYNSEVNLVLRSYYGFAEEQSQCIPFLINLRYFKPEY